MLQRSTPFSLGLWLSCVCVCSVYRSPNSCPWNYFADWFRATQALFTIGTGSGLVSLVLLYTVVFCTNFKESLALTVLWMSAMLISGELIANLFSFGTKVSCMFTIYKWLSYATPIPVFQFIVVHQHFLTDVKYADQPYTVVPALGDPRRERPPAVYGHFDNVPTHINVKLPLISGHLPNADADSHLLVVSTCYNGQCKQIIVFGGHFNQKLLACTQTWDRQFAQMSVLSSGDQRAICHVIETDEPRACGKPTPNHVRAAKQLLHWLRLFHDINGKVTYSVCSTRDVEEQNNSLFGPTNRGAVPSGRSTSCRALAAEPVRQNANGTFDIEANTESHRGLRWIQTFTYCRPTIHQLLCCITFKFTTIAYIIIIMTMHVFIRNIAGGDSSRKYCKVYYIWRPPPAHPSLWRTATCNVRTLLPDPEGVRSWQVLL